MKRFAESIMNKAWLITIIVLLGSCKEKFNSPVPVVATGYLVVEGIINSAGKGTNILLSRTTNLDSSGKKYEQGALVLLEDSRNIQTQLQETSIGSYTADSLHLDTAFTYRLVIRTFYGEEYKSDFVKVMYNPEIDSISWTRNGDGVELLANTHDPSGRAKYYQWEFDETWEFHSIPAFLKWIPSTGPASSGLVTVDYRETTDPQISTCWKFGASQNIITGSSANLAKDIINLPFFQIPATSQKISVLYSVLLKQYSWSKEGYEFLEKMKKNTETLGSVFDAQPSELTGNIHCTSNAALPAIGFFNVSAIKEKRIFIHNREVSGWDYQVNCVEYEVYNNTDSIKASARGMLPTVKVKSPFLLGIISFNVASPECVDCTLTGTNMKPVFWP